MFRFYVRILCSDFFTTCSDFMFGFYVQSLCSYFMFCSEFSGFMFRSLAGMTRILAVYPILQGVAWFSSPPCPIQIPTSETARYGCTGLGICTSFACHVCWEGATPATLKLDTRSGLNMYAKCYWAFQSHVIRSYTSPGLPVHHQATCTGQHTAETQTKIFFRTQFGLSFDRKGWAELVCVCVCQGVFTMGWWVAVMGRGFTARDATNNKTCVSGV